MTTEGAHPGCQTGKSGGILLAAISAQVGGLVAWGDLLMGTLGRGLFVEVGGFVAWGDLFWDTLGRGLFAEELTGWVVE